MRFEIERTFEIEPGLEMSWDLGLTPKWNRV